jgi:hypothetical protein
MIETTHQWLARLEMESAHLASLDCRRSDPDRRLEYDGFNLANCDAHCRLIIRGIESVLNSVNRPTAIAKNLLRTLLYRGTYGAFAEIAAYEWLARCHMSYIPQISLTPTEVLAKNGSVIDGKMFPAIFFDVKAFGFIGRLIDILKSKLEMEFPNHQVLISDSWDTPLITLSKLIESVSKVAVELRESKYIRKGSLSIRIQEKQKITVTSRSIEPYKMAKENALFPYLDAKQFTRNAPFALILVTHPWFNSGIISNDFAGVDTQFTRALARRAFMQFSSDTKPLSTICKGIDPTTTIAQASELLSAIFFLNVWPPDADPAAPTRLPSWVYLNPRAKHRLSHGHMAFFRADNVHGFRIDGFADDNY